MGDSKSSQPPDEARPPSALPDEGETLAGETPAGEVRGFYFNLYKSPSFSRAIPDFAVRRARRHGRGV